MAKDFRSAISSVNELFARRTALEVLQVNLGNMCNQRCVHCHIDAGPKGDRSMSREVMDDVIAFLSKKRGLILDITGGCPELNPDFRYFIEKAKPFVNKITVRSNLTVFFEEGMQYLPGFYKDNKIKLICSLPCYTKENVDKQRGDGVFNKSIEALKLLNSLGYGRTPDLELDLVYNPGGAFLPGDQAGLRKDYIEALRDQYGIYFNNLLTITNAPINRFEQYLRANGNFDEYMKLLTESFNKEVAGGIMCRNLLSVGYNGIVYDCDFNQALDLSLRDGKGKVIEISGIEPGDLDNREIIFKNHCYCCTAGSGSSCRGALKE
ncbi:MAG: arsenosugar biosynthesis radical SAM (seleno)protein ArsS [Candidatus Omnitrophota bacterium]